jgi:hypothetical protein
MSTKVADLKQIQDLAEFLKVKPVVERTLKSGYIEGFTNSFAHHEFWIDSDLREITYIRYDHILTSLQKQINDLNKTVQQTKGVVEV